MSTRREVLQTIGVSAAALALPNRLFADDDSGVELNDVQSMLNPTRVQRVVRSRTVDDLQAALRAAEKENRVISVAGGRHAMGGQQLASDSVHLDTSLFNRVIKFDKERGQIEVEAGIMWPELLAYLHMSQKDAPQPWTIRQKQTGVDFVSIAGTISANAHARGLRFKPFIDDIESFRLLDANGKLLECSRRENVELFRLAAGGYGMFGIITHATLRLAPRRKVQRIVEIIAVKDVAELVDARVDAGFLYGDCQYSTNVTAEEAAHPGVFSCYQPISDDSPIPDEQHRMTEQDWQQLYLLARTDKKKAFDAYARHYLSTNKQVYWSDTHQLAGNFDVRNLQEALVRHTNDKNAGTEMITEVYVRPENLLGFLEAARKEIVEHNIDLTYGTMRFIEQDDESFLAWAKHRQVCILCNLHVVHTDAGRQKAADDLRRLIGTAIAFGGRYYLTYHRWATRDQVTKAYPQFIDFLKLKRKHDPNERFQSTWYQHYKQMFADKL